MHRSRRGAQGILGARRVGSGAVTPAPVEAPPPPPPPHATDSATQLAEKLGLSLSGITGTGKGGQITRADVVRSRIYPG